MDHGFREEILTAAPIGSGYTPVAVISQSRTGINFFSCDYFLILLILSNSHLLRSGQIGSVGSDRFNIMQVRIVIERYLKMPS